jgi:type VI protein secretion system component VasK
MSTETPTERREAAATRRRWVTLAEVVAVAGVLIAALTLWTNWSDHRANEADKIAAQSSAARERTKIDLSAIVQDGGNTLLLKDARHDLQDVTITFPRALGVSPQRNRSLMGRGFRRRCWSLPMVGRTIVQGGCRCW